MYVVYLVARGFQRKGLRCQTCIMERPRVKTGDRGHCHSEDTAETQRERKFKTIFASRYENSSGRTHTNLRPRKPWRTDRNSGDLTRTLTTALSPWFKLCRTETRLQENCITKWLHVDVSDMTTTKENYV